MIASRDLLVVVERSDGQPAALGCEMLGLARMLADAAGGAVHACILGSGLDEVGDALVARGADAVHLIDAPELEPYHADAWMPDLTALIGRIGPAAVIAGHTAIGADLAPRLAFRLGSAVATACRHVAYDEGKLVVTRACYGGKAEEVVSFRVSPAVFTVKPKAFKPCATNAQRRGEILRHPSALDAQRVRTRVRETRRDADGDARLETAATVVAGGGGMKGPQGFALAARVAELLGGAVGASRVACDLGWCPPSWQIGLSGKTVAPELYIANVISGSGQHMAGCGNAGTIVAINSYRDAPIFRYARYGVVADCHQLMPALIERIEALGK